jgi:transposase InsO family protein
VALPWQESDTVDQRMKFIADVLRREESVAALCRRYGVSRQTGHTWIGRYLEGGASGLVDRSRAPQVHPNATTPAVVELVLGVRAAHPTWGPKKILASLGRRYPGLVLPAHSTASEILRRAGLTVPKRRNRASERPPSHLGSQALPNETWAIDFKGQFRTEDRRYCYPLTLEDGASRYLLRLQALLEPTTEGVQPILDAAFREYGLPQAMRSDNGPPFAAASFTGLTRLSVWWVQLGIRLDRTRPASPQQNGRLERFHRTLDEDACTPVRRDLRAQQDAFTAWRSVYNEERPHEALGMKLPSEVFDVSPRVYNDRLLPAPYDGMIRRKVHPNGHSAFLTWDLDLTSTLGGQEIGFQETGEKTWDLWFYQHKLGTLDTRTGLLTNGRANRQCSSLKTHPFGPWTRRLEPVPSPFR